MRVSAVCELASHTLHSASATFGVSLQVCAGSALLLLADVADLLRAPLLLSREIVTSHSSFSLS
jgi:hypothetical protein